MEKWEQQLVKDRVEKEYFIDPNGKIHKWKGTLKELDNWTSTHSLIAQTITGIKDGTASDYLHRLNWIIVGSSAGNFLKIANEPTQAQINTLFDLDYHRIRTDNGELFTF